MLRFTNSSATAAVASDDAGNFSHRVRISYLICPFHVHKIFPKNLPYISIDQVKVKIYGSSN